MDLEKLERLAKLRDDGILTEDEFNEHKAKLLGFDVAPENPSHHESEEADPSSDPDLEPQELSDWEGGYYRESLGRRKPILVGMIAIIGLIIVSAVGWFALKDDHVDDVVIVEVISLANVRDKPTIEGSVVVGTLQAGTQLEGKWVTGHGDTNVRWLEIAGGGEPQFVWEGNLRDLNAPKDNGLGQQEAYKSVNRNEIPKVFHGLWGTSSFNCQIAGTGDPGWLRVFSSGYEGHETYTRVHDVKISGEPSEIVVKVSEDPERSSYVSGILTQEWTISGDGNVLRKHNLDWGNTETFTRCQPDAASETVPIQPVGSSKIWDNGQPISGTCYAEIDGTVYMDGDCSGLGHGGSIFVSAEADGCSIDIKLNDKQAYGILFAYKDFCGDIEDDVPIGPFKAEGQCWVASNARLCLLPY